MSTHRCVGCGEMMNGETDYELELRLIQHKCEGLRDYKGMDTDLLTALVKKEMSDAEGGRLRTSETKKGALHERK